MLHYYNLARPCIAVSYDTSTFADLKWNLQLEGVELSRIGPDEFINSTPDLDGQYINLVVRDLLQREQVSARFDQFGVDRFTFVHSLSTIWAEQLGHGCFIYPYVGVAAGTIIGNDVIIHGHNGIGHQTTIGTGCIIGGFTMIGGSTKIGRFCHINIKTTIYDRLEICDHAIIAADSVIRKNLIESGTYATVDSRKKTVKIK